MKRFSQADVFNNTLYILFIVALLCLGGCNGDDETKAEKSNPTLAEYSLGTISVDQLDQFILTLNPNERRPDNSEPEQWYASLLRRLAIDRLLLEEAELVGAEQDPEFQLLQRTIERDAYSNDVLHKLIRQVELPDEEEIKTFFEQHKQRYQRNEQRRVFHIFKRFNTDTDRQNLIAEMKKLRERTLAGESFALLARSHSDSETRHNDGMLGLVERGRFTEDFDKVVFSLQENRPSEPVVTSDGVHLFWISEILEQQKLWGMILNSFCKASNKFSRLSNLMAAMISGIRKPNLELSPPVFHVNLQLDC